MVELLHRAVELLHLHEAAAVVVEDDVDELAVLILLERLLVEVQRAREVFLAVVILRHLGERVARLVRVRELLEAALEREERLVVVNLVLLRRAQLLVALADGVLRGGRERGVLQGGEAAIDADGLLKLALLLADLAHEE